MTMIIEMFITMDGIQILLMTYRKLKSLAGICYTVMGKGDHLRGKAFCCCVSRVMIAYVVFFWRMMMMMMMMMTRTLVLAVVVALQPQQRQLLVVFVLLPFLPVVAESPQLRPRQPHALCHDAPQVKRRQHNTTQDKTRQVVEFRFLSSSKMLHLIG